MSPTPTISPAKRSAPPVDVNTIEDGPKRSETVVKIEPENNAGPDPYLSGPSPGPSFNNDDDEPLLNSDNEDLDFVMIHSADAPRIPEAFVPYPALEGAPTPTITFEPDYPWPQECLVPYCEREPVELERSMNDRQKKALKAALNEGVHRRPLQLNEVDDNGDKTGKVVPIDLLKALDDYEKAGPVASAILKKLHSQTCKTPAAEDPVFQSYEDKVPEPTCLIPFLSQHPMHYVMMLGGVQGFQNAVSHVETVLNQISPDPLVEAINHLPAGIEAKVMEADRRLQVARSKKRWYKPLTWFNTPNVDVWEMLEFPQYHQSCQYYCLDRFMPKYCTLILIPTLWLLFLGTAILLWAHFCTNFMPANDEGNGACNSAHNLTTTGISAFIGFGLFTFIIGVFFQESGLARAANRLTNRIKEAIIINELRRMIREWRRFADFCAANPQATRYLPPYVGTQPMTARAFLNEILRTRLDRHARQTLLRAVERDEALNNPVNYLKIVNDPSNPGQFDIQRARLSIPHPARFGGYMERMFEQLRDLYMEKENVTEAERRARLRSMDRTIAAGVAVPGYGLTLPLREPRRGSASTAPAGTSRVTASTSQTTAAIASTSQASQATSSAAASTSQATQATASTSQTSQATSTTSEAAATPAQVSGGVSTPAALDLSSVSDSNAGNLSKRSAGTVSSSSDDSTLDAADTTGQDTTGELGSNVSRSSQSSNED